MSVEFFKKLNWLAGIILLGGVLGLAGLAAMIEIKDLDLWLHLRMGEYIWQNGYVPVVDVLSASFSGKPWIDHEWLFQVVLHWVRSGWGLDGLISMQSGIVVVTLALMLMMVYDKDRQLVHAPLLFLVMQVYQTRFTIRPDIFSLMFFVIYIFILSVHINKRWSVWVLFVLQILWSNMHGYALWGIIFVLIGLISETMKRRIPLPWEWNETGRLSDEEYKRMAWIGVVLVLANFINPFGLEGALYPFKTLLSVAGDSQIFFKNITELQPPCTWATAFDVAQHWPFKALIVVSFVSFIFNRRRLDISALLLWGVFLFFSLSAVRNISYFAFAAFFVTCYNLSNISFSDLVPFEFNDEKMFHLSGVMIAVLLIFQVMNTANDFASRGYYDFDKYEKKSEFFGVSQRFFPEKAAQFLIDNKISGNFFNDFNSGAYLIGRVYPQVMVYIDGRTELRGGEFFKKYHKIWADGDEELFKEAVDTYQLTGLFINTSGSSASRDMLRMVNHHKEWKLVYFDYDALVFLKDIPKYQELIQKFEIRLEAWTPLLLDVQRMGSANVLPYRYLRRAVSLKAMGYFDQALAEAQAALDFLPTYSEAYKVAGDVYAAKKEYTKAFNSFRLACLFEPGSFVYRKDLAMSYLDLDNPVKGLEAAQRAFAMDPNDVEAKYILARAYFKNKQNKKACDILEPIPMEVLKANDISNRVGTLLNEIRAVNMEKI